LTDTGILRSQPSCIAVANSDTSFGSSIKAAPKHPFPATFGLREYLDLFVSDQKIGKIKLLKK
jgi:hypothetical protein